MLLSAPPSSPGGLELLTGSALALRLKQTSSSAETLWAQAALSPSLPQSHTGCHWPCTVPALSLSLCCQLPLPPDLVPRGLSTFLLHQVVSVAAWAVLVLGMTPLPLPGLQTCASVSPPFFPAFFRRYLDVGGCGVMAVAGICPVAHPGAHDQQGIAVAKPCRASGTGKPSPWPLRDAWFCHPLPCGAFPLPSVSQPLACPLLQDGAGAGGPELLAGSAWAHARAWAELSPRTRVPLLLFEGRHPQVDTTPLMAWWGGQVSVPPEPC